MHSVTVLSEREFGPSESRVGASGRCTGGPELRRWLRAEAPNLEAIMSGNNQRPPSKRNETESQ